MCTVSECYILTEPLQLPGCLPGHPSPCQGEESPRPPPPLLPPPLSPPGRPRARHPLHHQPGGGREGGVHPHHHHHHPGSLQHPEAVGEAGGAGGVGDPGSHQVTLSSAGWEADTSSGEAGYSAGHFNRNNAGGEQADIRGETFILHVRRSHQENLQANDDNNVPAY